MLSGEASQNGGRKGYSRESQPRGAPRKGADPREDQKLGHVWKHPFPSVKNWSPPRTHALKKKT